MLSVANSVRVWACVEWRRGSYLGIMAGLGYYNTLDVYWIIHPRPLYNLLVIR